MQIPESTDRITPKGDVLLDSVRKKFSEIEDARHQSYVDHKLTDILIVVMSAVLCGLDELGDIITFAQNRKELLKDKFEIDKIPSKPTLSRVLHMIDGEKVGKVIVEIMREAVGTAGEVLAVDGKAICSTTKDGQPHSALQILTAYLTESGVILGQKAIHEKTNEIPVFQEMLDFLDVKNKIVTADAMHCQKDTCRKIVKKGGNYLFGLKENHKTLYDDVALFFSDIINRDEFEVFQTIEKNSGRLEKRICRKTSDISWLSCRDEWSNLQSIFEIRRLIETPRGRSEETCYYISSLEKPAEELMKIAREHWKIESLHWMLDVVFSEDDCKILSENGHKTLNAFRKLALLIHKHFLAKTGNKSSIKAHLLTCLLNQSIFAQILDFL